ncbi:MAG: oligosaccharide flippase family protein [Bacteroidetes bacterium]|nr:oligosaccharide flippase family protein [Bacteroidota bacterium]
MKKLRELFSDSLIYGISSVLARFVNYLLVPFHTDVFNPARYGIIGLIYAAIAFLNVLFTFGMESAYLRYAADRSSSRNIFKTLQLALLFFSTVLSVLLWLLMPVLLPLFNLGPENSGIILMMIGILWFDTLAIVPMAELRLVRKSLSFATLRIIHVIINVGLNFSLILIFDFGIEAVFLANLAASMVVTVLVWIYTSEMLKGEWSTYWMKRAFHFGWPFVLSGVGFAVNEMLDRFLLDRMDPGRVVEIYGSGFTPEDIVGIYNACYKLAVFMLLLVQMYRMAWQPFFMRHSEDKESPLLFAQAFYWYNAFSAILFLLVALYREQIVAIEIPVLNTTLIGNAYWSGLEIVPFLLMAYWFHGWYINFSSTVFIEEKTKIFYKITLTGAAITVVVNLLLIPIYGMTGSAIATLLSYATMALVLAVVSRRIIQVPYRLPSAFLLMIASALLVLSEPMMAGLTGLSDFWLQTLLFAIGFVVSILYLWVHTSGKTGLRDTA